MCYTYKLSNKELDVLRNTVYLCCLCKCFGLLGDSMLNRLSELYIKYLDNLQNYLLNNAKGVFPYGIPVSARFDVETNNLIFQAQKLLFD